MDMITQTSWSWNESTQGIFPLEFAVFMIFVSLCLFFRRHQLGILGTYAFVFYMGFTFHKINFVTLAGDTAWTAYVYIICGIIVVATGMMELMNKNNTQTTT